jgi:hypothetical protein
MFDADLGAQDLTSRQPASLLTLLLKPPNGAMAELLA